MQQTTEPGCEESTCNMDMRLIIGPAIPDQTQGYYTEKGGLIYDATHKTWRHWYATVPSSRSPVRVLYHNIDGLMRKLRNSKFGQGWGFWFVVGNSDSP